MMPLCMMSAGQTMRVTQCRAEGPLRTHLENLGLLPGQDVTMIAQRDGNVILKVHETRLAVNRGMANAILVEDIPAPASLHLPQSAGHDGQHGAGGGLHNRRGSLRDAFRSHRNAHTDR